MTMSLLIILTATVFSRVKAAEPSQEFWPCRCYEFSKAASENKRPSVALVKRAFILFTSFTGSDPCHTPAPPLFVWVTSVSDSSIICTVFTGTKGLVPTSAVHSFFLLRGPCLWNCNLGSVETESRRSKCSLVVRRVCEEEANRAK